MLRLLFPIVAILSALAFGQDTATKVVTTVPAQNRDSRLQPPAPGCAADHRTDRKAGVVISEVILEGPVSISSSELSTIKGQLVGACFDEQEDVVEQAVRGVFAEQGFAQAEVDNASLKAIDALAVPKAVTLKAEVTEGQRFRFGEITFEGNHVFSAAKLRAAFPIKRRATFQRAKIGSGFAEIRKLYAPRGYRDLVFEPGIIFSSTGTVALTISIAEGPQYRMGELKVYAKKEIADRLASDWRLREGAVFDLNYPPTFMDASHSLPAEIGRPDLLLVRNCPEASIAVLLIVDQTDPGLQNRPKEIPCEKTSSTE